MSARFDSLTLKLTMASVAFALLVSAATGLLVTHGFHRAQDTATARSVQGLEAQGRGALVTLTQREAQVSAAQFSQAAAVGQIAADYLLAVSRLGGVPWSATHHLAREQSGQYWDPDPARITDIFLPRNTRVGAEQLRDLRDSAALDALLPSLISKVQDASSIYFISSHAAARYYPAVNVAQYLPPDYSLLGDPSYSEATPSADPQRATVWRAPYINPQQQGLQVTASTPVYAGDQFRGVICVDVSLGGLIYHLNSLKPTQGGYAFLVDHNGRLVAAPPSALGDLLDPAEVPPAISLTTMLGLSLTSSPNAALRHTLSAMRNGEQGVTKIQLGGRMVFLSYAPLSGLRWSLGLVAPLSEITSQSGAVAAAIHGDANATIVSTLLALGICFAVVLAVTLWLSRWQLVRPITALTAATRAVAAGDLTGAIPVTRRDELGQLARSFNSMTSELAQFYEVLEQRVRERTRELSALLEVSRNVTSTLELAPLLDLILDQLQSMVPYTSATIIMLEGDDLVVLEYRGPAPRELLVHLRFPLEGAVPHIDVVRTREPVIIANTERDTAVTLAFLRQTGKVWANSFGHIRSWMGVPLILKDRIMGVLAMIHSQPDFYTPHHAQLATVIAAQAAVAIENAQLYAQAQEFAAFKERSRLARELHDSVSQALYGIALGARTAHTLLARDPARAAEPLEYVLSLAEAGLVEMRALIFELRPESLETEGLAAALGHQVATLRARHGLSVSAEIDAEPDVPFPVKEALYRIAQEALHNTVKHARSASVELRVVRDEAGITLEVCDDGIGFDPGASFPGHMGLRSMRERVATLGGTVEVLSAPGTGTRVRVRVPC